ncbi:glycosyltransferase family 2 protein, partial [Campylobacter jejuni]|nr:glycosyltransferase family 2 protein [Campylobacter jejuni]EKP6578480.1 glycosyltransferase family 2 protein [Campylobacter jejuni]
MEKNPLVSIIIPCYNAENFIENCINSIINQTYINYEIICVDDGSTDNTLKILKNLSINNSRLKAYSINHTGIPSVVKNYGLKLAKGEFLLILDSDDMITEYFLEKGIKYFQDNLVDIILYPVKFMFSNNNYKIIGGIYNNSLNISDVNYLGATNKIISGRDAFRFSIYNKLIGFPFYKKTIDKIINFNEESFNGDEYSFREHLLQAKKIAFIDTEFYVYNFNQESITKKIGVHHWDTWKTWFNLEKLAQKHNYEKKLIKKINKIRYSIYYELCIKFNKTEYLFSQNEKNIILNKILENKNHLSRINSIFDF